MQRMIKFATNGDAAIGSAAFHGTHAVKGIVAETEGFEPSVPNYQYDGLANRWFQPLTHVSCALWLRAL
jgi:hypothetical protein